MPENNFTKYPNVSVIPLIKAKSVAVPPRISMIKAGDKLDIITDDELDNMLTKLNPQIVFGRLKNCFSLDIFIFILVTIQAVL